MLNPNFDGANILVKTLIAVVLFLIQFGTHGHMTKASNFRFWSESQKAHQN